MMHDQKLVNEKMEKNKRKTYNYPLRHLDDGCPAEQFPSKRIDPSRNLILPTPDLGKQSPNVLVIKG